MNRVPMNTLRGSSGGDDAQADKLAARKFEMLGWRVGKTRGQHRCPECVRLATNAFAKLEPLKKGMTEMPTNNGLNGPSTIAIAAASKSAPAPTPLATPPTTSEGQVEPPPKMTRDDRRVIFAKLNEVYQDESHGYALDWSDKRVAEDLGVPRAWVSEVRDLHFGPDRNAEFMEQIAVAQHMIEETRTLAAEAQKLADRHAAEVKALRDRIDPMLKFAEKTEKTIHAIEKAIVP